MTRRIVLPALCLAVTLFGCSKKAAEPVAQAPSAPGVPAQDSEKLVNLYTWADYFTPEVLEAFTQATGIKVQVDTFDTNEAMQGKLMAGATGYDVVVPSDYAVTIMSKSSLLLPLDHSRLPNLVNIEEQFQNPAYDPGNKFSVPFQWGTSGIGYLSDKVTDPVKSWNMLFNPPDKYKGRLSMMKDMRENFGAALRMQGRSVNSRSEQEIKEARELLQKQSKVVKTYNSESYKDLLAQGEVWLAHGWSANFSMARYKQNDKIRFAIPDEGGIIYMDTLAIAKGAPHPNNAHIFINYFLGGKAGAEVSNTTYGSSPNKAARPYIRPELINDPVVYPSAEVINKLEYVQDVGEATRIYDQEWTEIRAQ